VRANRPAPAVAQIRVAAYARASVSRALEFDSVTAQVEAITAYVASQRSAGWVLLPEPYIDDGYSGGDTHRPAYQRMVADIEAGKVDLIATYRLDRVSRSLPDFTAFMANLEKLGVGFCSVTQSFDSTTSMGKLVMNLLGAFSEFERATIAERTADKIAAARRRGLWTGGRPVLGFDVRDKHLVVNADEANAVREIYRAYLEHAGLIATVAELEQRSIRNKSWTNQDGKPVRGEMFDKSTLRALLTNPLYVGRIRAGKETVPARHEAIVEQSLFDEVQRALQERRRTIRIAASKHGALLCGLLRCARCGAAMTHATNARGSRVHRYYVCQTVMKQGAAKCQGSRAPAGEIEEVVASRVRAIGQEPAVFLATLATARQQRAAHEPGLVTENRRIGNEKTQLAEQRKNLLDALQTGGVATNVIVGRLAEVDEHLSKLDARQSEVIAELAAIASGHVDEADLRATLEQFTPIWDELIPRERARVLRLLISEVRYDGQAGEVTIQFRDNGLRALAREATARRPA